MTFNLTRHCLLVGTCLLWFNLPTLAQTKNAYPMLMSLQPTAVQIGQTTEHELSARYNLAGASQVIFSREGIKAEIVLNEADKPDAADRNDVMASKCKLKIWANPESTPGICDFRVMTPHGVSTLGQLVLVRDLVVREMAGNDTLSTAQLVELPTAICGAIEKAEDVDYFKFSVAAGTSLVMQVHSQRLLNRLHDMQTRIDPMITIKNEKGTTLAANDNFYAGDPLLHYTFEHDGTYVLEVRDVRYQGNVEWAYVVEVNSRPFVTQVSPLAIKAGEPSTVQLYGFNLPANASVDLNCSSDEVLGVRWMSHRVVNGQASEQPTNDFGVFVTGQEVVHENAVEREAEKTEVVGSGNDSSQLGDPQVISIPSVLSGRIHQAGEVDRYYFDAKAKEKLTIELVARRARSPLDPVVRILNDKGAALIENDDGIFRRVASADSLLEGWTAPADGRYCIEVRDLHQRGGENFTYALQATRAEPYFMLEADTDKTLLAPGMYGVVYVRGVRKNGFAGEIQLSASELPEGVEVIPGRILAEGTDGALLFHAKNDVAIGAKNIVIEGTGIHREGDQPPLTLHAVAKPFQEYYAPGGGRGNYPVDLHTISVARPMDLRSIQLSTTEIELKPGSSQRMEITIERAPDYQGNVTLDVMLQHLEQPFGKPLPKGVTVDVSASKTLLTKEETKGYITLKAAADAPLVERQLVPVNAHVSINFVMKHTLCGPPVHVSVK